MGILLIGIILAGLLMALYGHLKARTAAANEEQRNHSKIEGHKLLLTRGWIGIATDISPDGVFATEHDMALAGGQYMAGDTLKNKTSGGLRKFSSFEWLILLGCFLLLIFLGVNAATKINNPTAKSALSESETPLAVDPEKNAKNIQTFSGTEQKSTIAEHTQLKKHNHKQKKSTKPDATGASDSTVYGHKNSAGDNTSTIASTNGVDISPDQLSNLSGHY